LPDYVDPNSFLDMWPDRRWQQRTGWSNLEYDRLIADGWSPRLTRSSAWNCSQQAGSHSARRTPPSPIYFTPRPSGHQSGNAEVKGYYPTILDNHPYKYCLPRKMNGKNRE